MPKEDSPTSWLSLLIDGCSIEELEAHRARSISDGQGDRATIESEARQDLAGQRSTEAAQVQRELQLELPVRLPPALAEHLGDPREPLVERIHVNLERRGGAGVPATVHEVGVEGLDELGGALVVQRDERTEVRVRAAR